MPTIRIHPTEHRGFWRVGLWACFLGSSWTWVIGMLWPVLLVRDYGPAGWFVFAIPNVVGAAAMGWMLSSPEASRRVLERHLGAALRFSDVTIAYHVFAVVWIYTRLMGWGGPLAVAAAALVITAGGLQRRAVVLVGAALVTAASLAMFVAWLILAGPTWAQAAPPRLTQVDLALLMPAMAAGFLLCPYLDLTFHRARQATEPAAGRWAFLLGFGGVFLVMIAFSLFYSGALEGVMGRGPAPVLPRRWLIVLSVHLVLQAAFTIAVHLREVIRHGGHAAAHRTASLAVAAVALAWWAHAQPVRDFHGLSVGEAVYRGFLLIYGLIFPAYVWLCMLPSRSRIPPHIARLMLVVAILIALPMAYQGFLAGRAMWVPLALAVLAAARVVLVWIFPPASSSGGPSSLQSPP